MMALFADLAGQSLQDLKELFVSDNLCPENSEDKDLWLQEIAVMIVRSGNDGVTFLLQAIPRADPSRLRAILLAFSFLDAGVAKGRMAEFKKILLGFLGADNPLLIAQAIDALNDLGVDIRNEVNALLSHPSPYVVGSVLRYLSRHYPGDAKPILLKSLRSQDPIIRQNAIDELDSLVCGEALESIRSLVNDQDKNVRQAAQTAVSNLEAAGFAGGNGALVQAARRN
jgi:hypothetical protein